MEQAFATVDHEAEQNLTNIGIPPCPAILTTLIREMRADEPDFAKVGKLLSGDVGLAAAMLKTVNSPFYALPTKAASVQKALALLGLRNVAQLVTGLLLRQAFPVTDNELMEQFWEDSSAVSAIMAHLAPRFSGIDRDEAYTFGLFRDCGIPVMMSSCPDYINLYRDVCRQQKKSLPDLEGACLGISHPRVGYELARSWYLADHACEAIRWHHDCSVLDQERSELAPASASLIALGLLAEALYTRHRDGPCRAEWQRSEAAVLPYLELAEEDFESLLGEVDQALAQQ